MGTNFATIIADLNTVTDVHLYCIHGVILIHCESYRVCYMKCITWYYCTLRNMNILKNIFIYEHQMVLQSEVQ